MIPGDHQSFVTDVTSFAAVQQLMTDIKARFGGQVPSIVLTAAGDIHNASIVDMSEEQFDSLIAVHFKVRNWCFSSNLPLQPYI